MNLAFKHLSATGTGQLATSAGLSTLWTVNVNTGATSAILTLYNGTSTAGAVIAVIDATSKSSQTFGTRCENGLFYNLAGGNADVTIGYT